MKTITVTYEWWTVTFEIDEEYFTETEAQGLLEFFDWEWDRNGDLVIIYCRKLAMKIIGLSTNLSLLGIKNHFKSEEGFPRLDGSAGIELTDVNEWEFQEEDFLVDEN